MRRTILSLLATLVVAAGCSSAGRLRHGELPATDTSAPGPSVTAGPSTAPPVPPLDWQPCGPFECATLQVPLDAADLGGRQIGIALNRRRATEPDRRIGSLLVNPGGPGASGVDGLPGLLARLSEKVKACLLYTSPSPRDS